MEFFGLTLHGPQNSLKDILKSNYKEPQSKEDVQLIMEEIIRTSTMPKKEKNTNVSNISISRSNKDAEETRFIFKFRKFACDVTDRYIVYVYRYILEIQRPDVKIIRVIDCYIGRVNGFAYGSSQRFNKMKRKGVIKPVGPADMFRLPPTTSIEYGWWQHDTALLESSWHLTHPRRPQPSSPNTLILDIVRKNNKYATLF